MSKLADVYPSPRGEESRILPRIGPVVYGDGDPLGRFSLTTHEVEFFDHNGYLLLENHFTPGEIRRFQREVQHLRSDPDLLHRPEVITEPDSEAVRSIFRPHAFSPLFDRVGRSTRLLDIVQQ